MQQKLYSAICEFAKKQMTWFRKMEKEGIKINWIEGADFKAAEKLIKENFPLGII
jgi:tRNA dimethylallyltransferase